MIRFLIHRPISVIVLIVGLLCLSAIAFQKLRVSLLPDIGIPEMRILVETPQMTAVETEQKILAPLRRYLLAMNGLEEVESTAVWGTGELSLRFAYGTDMDKAFIETNEMVDLSMNNLPNDIDRPRVIKMRAEDLPVYYLSLKYSDRQLDDNFLQLSEFAREVLRRRLERLPEIALVDVHGIKRMQVVMEADEDRLASLELDQQDLQEALMANQMNLTSVTVKEREYQYLVRMGRPFTSVRDLQKAQIAIDDRIIPLGDLARITTEEQTPTGAFVDRGQAAVSLAIIKTPNASLEQLEKQLRDVCDQVRQERPDIDISISRDQTRLLKTTLNNLQSSLILGCLLAIGIVFFFYSQWRIPVIIGIIIPVSLLLSVLFFQWIGLSLNMISLSGLLLGLGLMIDNGIIVLDNISQEWTEQTSLSQACVSGANQMIRPLLTSMLTTCSVFFPLILISGITGALFWDQALSVSIGLMTSYLISITLLPTLYFVILKRKEVSALRKHNLFTKALRSLYERGFHFTFTYPALASGLISLFLAGAVWLVGRIPINRFPPLPEKALEMQIDWDAPLQPEVAAKRIDQIFEGMEVSWQAHIGVSQYLLNVLYDGDINSAEVYVRLPEGMSSGDLQKDIQNRTNQLFPSAQTQFSPEKNAFELLFPSPGETITIQCFINESDEFRAEEIYKEVVKKIAQIPEVNHIQEPDYDQSYWVQPRMDRMMQYEIEEQMLVAELKKMLSEHELMQLKSFQYSVPVVIRGKPTSIETLRHQGQLKNEAGVNVPLQQLIEIQPVKSMRKIRASGEGRYWPIWITSDQPERVEQVTRQIERQYPSLNIKVVGAYKSNKKLINEIVQALLLSIVLLYFLLTAQFESFLQPLIILLEIPISLAGAVFFLWLFGASINVMSLIGMVVTIGIVINDSIIKIDTINRLVNQGLPIREAVHQGGLKRLNPIIMTSLTTILAVTPFLWGNDLGSLLQRPLALSLIGGMLVGTLVSLYVIPLLYFFSMSHFSHRPDGLVNREH